MKKTKNKKLFSYIITLIFIVLILYFTKDQWHKFNNIKKINLSTIFILSILFIIFQLFQGYLLRVFTSLFNVKLSNMKSFGLVSIRSFGNYLPLNSGVIYNAVYLKKRENLPITKFASVMGSSLILMILSYGVVGLFTLICNYILTSSINIILIMIVLIFIFLGVLALFIPLPSINSEKKIVKWINSIQNGWKLIRRDRKTLIKIISIHISTLILFTLRFLLIFKDLSININLSGIIILSIMTTVLRINTIFPGNLGLRESVAGGVSRTFGFTFSIGFLAGIIDRIIVMFWIFLFGIIFSFVLLKKHPEKN